MSRKMPKNCPWCGHAMRPDSIACEKCKWTRNRPNMRPAFLAFGFFILLSAVLAIAAMKWVSIHTGELRPSLNFIARNFVSARTENRE